MDTIIRGAAVYLVLLLLFRIAGRRTLSQATTFDFVLLLIISEAVQQAMIDDDNSMTSAFLLVLTLVGMNVGFSLLKRRSTTVARLVDGVPVVVMSEGRLLRDRMDGERLEESDLLSAAREQEGIARLDAIDYAVVEESGKTTIVPRKGE